MRFIYTILGVAMVTVLQADTGCKKKLELLDQYEKAYDEAMRSGLPGIERAEKISRFIVSGDETMAECSKQIAFDRRYALKHKLARAKELQGSYRDSPRPFGNPRGDESYQRGVIKTH